MIINKTQWWFILSDKSEEADKPVITNCSYISNIFIYSSNIFGICNFNLF